MHSDPDVVKRHLQGKPLKLSDDELREVVCVKWTWEDTSGSKTKKHELVALHWDVQLIDVKGWTEWKEAFVEVNKEGILKVMNIQVGKQWGAAYVKDSGNTAAGDGKGALHNIYIM